ncbi:RNA-directed DNA polymerase [Handroanthus impetiginosus]|uniref:RNA-directed DNA polymerase n=1 Tax=Handroanthus impetiginosus TaxID=429701 RepID=A0A2G9H5U3_9LAMI|nr:RNA-directed DNA polymerase [Handroanthus impetiginosus]
MAHATEEKYMFVDLFKLDLLVVVFEANLINNTREWWMDIGAIRHMCSHKLMFSTYIPLTRCKLYMGNSSTSNMVGLGKVMLKLTSGKKLILIDMVHVLDFRRNLLSGSLLVKSGFRLFVLTKNGQLLGRSYVEKGFLKFNVMLVLKNLQLDWDMLIITLYLD